MKEAKHCLRKICEEFGKNIDRHISVYGAENNQRLTGLHETQSIDKFSYGVSDRGASIRIPVGTIQDGWKGRLEDRRPASNGDLTKLPLQLLKLRRKHSLHSLLGLNNDSLKAMEQSIAFFISFFHHHHKFILILFEETKNEKLIFNLMVKFSFSTPIFNPRCLNRLCLFTD